MDLGRVAYYLDVWRDYMKSHTTKLGFKSTATGFMSGSISSFEDLEEIVDSDTARAVDSAIDDLPPMPKTAIYVRILGEKTFVDENSIDRAYGLALSLLEKKLTLKNLY